jgi:hypothetical protein
MSNAPPPQHSDSWNPEFTGHLIPRHPRDGGPSSPVIDTGGCIVSGIVSQVGPHHSRWLRLSDPSSSLAAAAVMHQAATFSAGALYVAFDEWSSHPVLLNTLRSCGFKFYAHTDAVQSGGGGELVYYKWCRACDDLVPAAASSIEGTAPFSLSSDLHLNSADDCIAVARLSHFSCQVSLYSLFPPTSTPPAHPQISISM